MVDAKDLKSRRPPPPLDKARQGLAHYRDTVSRGKRRAIERAIKAAHGQRPDQRLHRRRPRRVQRRTFYKHHDG